MARVNKGSHTFTCHQKERSNEEIVYKIGENVAYSFQEIIGRPFVKRFALCYRTVVCLSVCNVGVLWPNGWIDQDETCHAGRPCLWPHCVRWGTQVPLPKGAQPHPIFGLICSGQIAGRIKMPLSRKVGPTQATSC